MLDDAELTRARLEHYRLLAGLLAREPSAGQIGQLRQGIADRVRSGALVHPLMGEGWRELQAALAAGPDDAPAEEFFRLFLDPFHPAVQPYESYYLTGHLFRAPLVQVRRFLARIGLARDEAASAEPEDHLAFELDVMRWLVERQAEALGTQAEARWLALQVEFVGQHLLVWVPTCCQDVEGAEGAAFYRGVALLLRGYLDTERELLQAQGLGQVKSLEAARREVHDVGWRGPTFDPGGGGAP
ncbi:MAG: molecular chaperone TorD family protein [Candidatus Lambdaproteobacteria bacterium]|nr:molecular chaperone TorD family protein [Candidatus Lambdaproteobacteria bacterium]